MPSARTVRFRGVRLAPPTHAPYRCGATSREGWVCDKVKRHRGEHIAACTYVDEDNGAEHYDEIMHRWPRTAGED